MTTTSASCLSATPRATVAPTLPAPPTTVTFRFIEYSSTTIDAELAERSLGSAGSACSAFNVCLHVTNDCVAEFGRLQFLRAVHEPREVVRHGFRGDRAVH